MQCNTGMMFTEKGIPSTTSFKYALEEGLVKSSSRVWNGDCSNGALLVIYREIQEGVATQRFDKFWSACQNLKDDDRLPFDLPITTGRIDKGEPCNSPNFNGCLCIKETWSDEEEEDQTSEEDDN